MVTAASAPVSTQSQAVELSADSTALIVCGTTCPTPDAIWVERIMNQFIAPTHPGQTTTPVAVTTPQEYWPITGLFRLVGFAVGDPTIWGPGGPGWPDEPWWKLTGLFDLTIDRSIRAGVADLEQAMAQHGNDHLVIYGLSQGATVANTEKRKLAEQYPAGTPAPDIDFVLQGDPNHPNGGLSSRFPGLYIPILDLSFDGPAPTGTQFDTIEINRQYDGASDFPLYPLNVVASLNALLGFVYLHTHPFDVSLPADPTTSQAYQGTHGDTRYYFFETENLPLFAPLRSLGVPEALIDVVEPFFRVLVELGYDRSIPPWEPTPARLIPTLNPVTVTSDLVAAIGEGINNAATLISSPPPRIPAPVALGAATRDTADADTSDRVTSTDPLTQTEQVPSRESVVDTGQTSTDTETSTSTPSTPSTTSVTETDLPTSPPPDADAEASEGAASNASTSKPARPLVRDSRRADPLSARSKPGEDDQSTTRIATAGDEAATGEFSKATESSSAKSSSASSPLSGGSSDGDRS
ncbi:PE-PPE domain-containing protein [Mycolicibacterium lacusdiani]|uniref:PE-PPE domain-containing protein n=1 Tax=Mycolicibacterium lacusdiani TaxID=2895283 RepID=UPI001F28DE69|nr:PE-PPE domain-containing protein [Mycolicibacterium lacusdiani]